MARRDASDRTSEERGVCFPLVDGSRSSMATGQAVLADAARVVDPALADDINSGQDWHGNYLEYVRRLTEAEVTAGHDAAAVPKAGLESLHRRFQFLRDGESLPLEDAFRRYDDPRFRTVVVHGDGDVDAELAVPYRGQVLRGDDLRRQLGRWLESDAVESSFAVAVDRVIDNPDWLDLSDHTFVVFGAGSEMGPMKLLSRWRANIVPVDRPRPAIWKRVLAAVRAGQGTARVPVQQPVDETDMGAVAGAAGADLVEDMPEIGTWLADVPGPLTLGNYVYADGSMNVRVSMAVDALISHVLADRGHDDVSIAVLVTPTDTFAVPARAVETSRVSFGQRSRAEQLAHRLSGGRVYAPNYTDTVSTPDGVECGIADCLVPQQGANYAIAQRVQRWRARLARDDGVVSSANVAAATRTRSVTKNRILAAAYAGAPHFDVEVLEPPTSQALMAALLVHDLRYEKSAAHPGVPFAHPLELFVETAIHGGLWRIPFAPRSVLPLAAVIGMARGGLARSRPRPPARWRGSDRYPGTFHASSR